MKRKQLNAQQLRDLGLHAVDGTTGELNARGNELTVRTATETLQFVKDFTGRWVLDNDEE